LPLGKIGPAIATDLFEQNAPGSQNGVGHVEDRRTAKMANSINTNVGAMVALQNLNTTSRELNVVQNRVNTGLKVASAKDNGAIYAIASGLRAESAALDSVKSSIQRGQSIVDVALAAGDVVVEGMKELKQLAVSIASSTGAAKTAYEADFTAIKTEIDNAIAGATFDGVNLFLAHDATTNNANIVVDAAGTTKALGAAATTVTLTSASTSDEVSTALDTFTAVLAGLGTTSKSLDRTLTFTSKLQDSIDAGVGNLVDADLAKESARLTALQTKQQLGVQALAIANQSSSILLGLFR
jgi:flagellin